MRNVSKAICYSFHVLILSQYFFHSAYGLSRNNIISGVTFGKTLLKDCLIPKIHVDVQVNCEQYEIFNVMLG